MSGGPRPRDATELWAQARASHCEDLALNEGVVFRRVGAELRSGCPICGGGQRSLGFAVHPRKNVFLCHVCGVGGGAIELEQALRGGTRREAAERLTGAGGAGRGWSERFTPRPARPVAAKPPAGAARSYSAAVGARLLQDAVSAEGQDLALAWFAARGLDPAGIPGGLRRLLVNARAFAAGGRGWERRAPALVARLQRQDAAGRWVTTAAHATYLSEDGAAKARLTDPDGGAVPARKVWGQGRRAGIWLTPPDTPPDVGGPLLVGEGIETVWSVAQTLFAAHQPCRAVAVASLANLQGAPLRDRWGAFDPDAPQADPDVTPFTVADAGAVIVLVDRDMSPIEVKAKGLFGRAVRRTLTAEDRARLCAGLARQAWLRAGAESVAALAPRPGQDFNDALRALTGA